jgi:predicted porin
MKKSLIALAVAGVVSAPAAFAATANVDIYGILDGSVSLVEVKAGGVTLIDNVQTGNVGNVDASRFGIKGAEDLGGGLKAIWQVESKLDVDAATSIGERNTFVGLSGGFGTVVIGRHDTPEKMSTGKLDLFADSVGDYNLSGTILDTREKNVLAYIAPNFSGLTVSAAAVAGEDSGATPANDGIADHYSLAATYENGPLYIGAGYTSVSAGYQLSALKIGGGTIDAAYTLLDDADTWRIGAGYSFGNLKLAAVYQSIELGTLDGGNDSDGYSLGAAYTMGNIVLKGQYMSREDMLEGYAIGVDYNLSKRTKAYVTYTDLSEENSADDVDVSIASVGVRHSF